VRVTLCGLPFALSLSCTLALRTPVADGVNVTEIVQLEPAASVEDPVGQLSVSVKSPELVPLTAMLLIESAALPEFVSVTDCAELVVPTS
jgi:hypothetical protein